MFSVDANTLIWIVFAFFTGAMIVWFFHPARRNSNSFSSLQRELELTKEHYSQQEQLLNSERLTTQELRTALARGESDLNNAKIRLEEQKALIEDLNKKMNEHFTRIANEVLVQNSRHFSEQTRQDISTLLNPFRENLDKFSKRVDENRENQVKDMTSLKEQIRLLTELNHQVNEEAHNLTRALKGDAKVRGDWGEVILERILEKSGLVRGREYDLQVSHRVSEEDSEVKGKQFRPDAIVYLPQERNIIIDSKVSLIDYERYVNASSDEERERSAGDHLRAMRAHLRVLAEKDYSKALDINSPDFVFMFVPIEPAFTLAMQVDSGIYEDALNKKIVIITPSTLIASLRVISSLWRQEKQNSNALKIAETGGKLYDKLVAFVGDIEEIGKSLDKTQETYSRAYKRLSSGRGNLIQTAENMKDLGAKVSKEFSQKYLAED